MPIVTIQLRNKKFQLSCSNKDHLLELASILDSELEELSSSNVTASFELILVMKLLDLMSYKQSVMVESAVEILKQSKQDFQKTLSLLHSELSIIANKCKKC